MSGHRQFRGYSLEDLSFRRVCRQLDETCRRLQKLSERGSIPQALAFARETIRPYYVNALPSRFRSRIIEETLEMMHDTVTSQSATIYLLAILLTRDIKHLKVAICCYYGCRHQSYLLKLLASEGIGLESLNMTRSSLLLFDCDLFHSALLNMRNLSKLTLRKIASDAMLNVIGKACAKLEILDVAYSEQITDAGLMQLLLQVESLDEVSIASSSQRRTKAQQCWLKFKDLFNISRKDEYLEREERGEKPDILLKYHEGRNSLCKTLKMLNITKTRVTYISVLLVLINVRRLEVLSNDENIPRIIMFTEKKSNNLKIPCNLTEMRIPISNCLNILEKAHISTPFLISLKTLHAFPRSTSLTAHKIPVRKGRVMTLYNYLRANEQYLRKLDLKTHRCNWFYDIDAREILIDYPDLHTLNMQGIRLHTTKECNTHPLRYLKRKFNGHMEYLYRI